MNPLALPAVVLSWGWGLLAIFAVSWGGSLSGAAWTGLLVYALLPPIAATYFARRAGAVAGRGDHAAAFRTGWLPPLILAGTIILPFAVPLEQHLRP